MRHGSSKDFDFLYKKAKSNETSSILKNDFFTALSCSKEPYLLSKYLNDQSNNKSNTLTALRNVATKPYGYLIAWNYLKSNWDDLYSR